MSQARAQPAELTKQDDGVTDDLAEIMAGLALPQKVLSPKFFYDDRGSRLFDAITELPEYYLTDAELEIMQRCIGEIVDLVGPRASLIEFGSGSSMKTRILLQQLDELAAYVPVDISREYLVAAAEAMAKDFPDIEILPVAADFTQPFKLPNPRVMPLRNIVYFPGSTIGNFTADAALELLKVMHHEAGEDGALLIGVDLQKDVAVIERAYNDDAGVTAEFNRNILQRINNEFGGDFDLAKFAHRAAYDEEFGRVEMHLVSMERQSVDICGSTFEFDAGETILTEYSHKYTLEGFATMAAAAGFTVDRVWTDSKNLFSVQYCVRT